MQEERKEAKQDKKDDKQDKKDDKRDEPKKDDQCPAYRPPLCKDSETRVPTGMQPNGCEGPIKCVKNPRACEDGYHPGPTDKCIKDGVVSSTTPVQCPVFKIAGCQNEEKMVSGPKLPNGCDGPPQCVSTACEVGFHKNAQGSCIKDGLDCPVYNPALCKDFEKEIKGPKLENGCYGPPKCVKVVPNVTYKPQGAGATEQAGDENSTGYTPQ